MPRFPTAIRTILQQEAQTSRRSTRNTAASALPADPSTQAHQDSETNNADTQDLRDFLERNLGEEDNEDDADNHSDSDSADDDDDDDEEDRDDVERQVSEVFDANIQVGTRKGYRRSQAKFAVWIYEQATGLSNTEGRTIYQNLLHIELYSALESSNELGKDLIEAALPFIKRTSADFHPILLHNLNARQFISFLLSFTPSGVYNSKSFYGGFRAALFDLFRESDVVESDTFKKHLKKSFSGLKKKAQQYKDVSGTRLGEGKKALPFDLYKKLCEWMISDGSKLSLFSWAFLTITWNLCCRSKNTVHIHRNHISWEGDSLIIQFAHSKTDQQGMNEAFKRHIFANNLSPTICPVLALSVYLATTPISHHQNGKLFGGKNQYSRFRKHLMSLVRSHVDEILSMGIDPSDIGVHSIRKGSATYVMNGTTSAPSIAALCNRAGWTMGKVRDTYLNYEAAQDQYVGRIVCGLNVNSYQFSASPPHFLSSIGDEEIFNDMSTVFPFVISIEHRLFVRFCLASLIMSKDFLGQKMGQRSPMRSNVVMQGRLRCDLSSVTIKYAHQESDVIHTGIPAHVIVLVNQERQRERLEQIYALLSTKMDETSVKIIDAVRADLDSRGIHGGDVSVIRFQDILRPFHNQLNALSESIANIRSASNPVSTGESTTQEETRDILTYRWGEDNKFRRLPENYKFNRDMTLLQAWQHWHHGHSITVDNVNQHIPPLKRIEQLDITDSRRDVKGKMRPIRDTEVRYWQFLRKACCDLDAAAEVRGRPSIAEINSMYASEQVSAILPPVTTDRDRERRANELSWQYAAKVMQERKRRRLT